MIEWISVKERLPEPDNSKEIWITYGKDVMTSGFYGLIVKLNGEEATAFIAKRPYSPGFSIIDNVTRWAEKKNDV